MPPIAAQFEIPRRHGAYPGVGVWHGEKSAVTELRGLADIICRHAATTADEHTIHRAGSSHAKLIPFSGRPGVAKSTSRPALSRQGHVPQFSDSGEAGIIVDLEHRAF